MTLEQINNFLNLAQTLNFTKTAELLYTTQPTISRQIKLLEEELGFDLLYRKTNGISLTPSGKVLYEKLTAANAMIESGVKMAKDTASCENGELRIGCLISLDIDSFLVKCYKTFVKNYPCIHFVYEKHGFKRLRQMLKDNELDLIFTLDSKPNIITDVEVRYLFESTGVCVFSKNDVLADKEDLVLKDFDNRSIVCLLDDSSPRGLAGIKKICDFYDLHYNGIIQVPNLETVFFYVDAGFGIALLDKSAIRVHYPDFKLLDTPDEVAKVSVIALWNKDNYNPAIASFMNLVLKEAEKSKDRYY